jgi:tetratricopeptide (TPR) repeat protein
VIVVAGALAMFGWLSWMTVAAAVAESKIAKATEMREGAGQVEPANSGRPWVTWTRQTAKALSLLEAAVRLDPTNARGHLEIGRAYEGLALRAWNAGVSAEGRLLSETAQRAEESRLLMGKALAAFARAAYLAPMEREVWGEIGWAHGILARTLPDEQAGSDREASLLAFRRGMALRPNDPYPFQLQAEFAFQWAQGQRGRLSAEQILASEIYQAGIRATQQLIELQPGFLPEALNRVLLFTRDFAVIQRVIPTHAPDFLFAARLLEDQGLSGVSRLALERAVTLAGDEDRPIFYQYLAEDSIKRGELSDAIRLLEFIHGLDPQNPDIRIMLGNAFARQKVYDRAEMEYEAAVEMARRLAPSTPFRTVAGGSPSEPLPPTRLEMVESALRERGLLPVDQGRDPLAKALAALAAFHEMSEQPRLAIPLWEQAIARTPRDSEIHFGYGESLDSVGAWIAAQGEYRKALELDPANVGLRLRLASKYEEHGLVEQAIAMWQEIARIRPGNVQAHVSLAGAYENLGRRKDAEVEYDQILRLDPGNEVAREALTRLRRGVVRERRSLSSASRAPETKSGESLPSEPESDSN